MLAGELGIPLGGCTSRGIADGIPVEVLDVPELPESILVGVAVGCLVVGAKMMELGMDIEVAVSVPVGTSDAGAWEEMDVVAGAEIVVLAAVVVAVDAGVEDGVEMTSLLVAEDACVELTSLVAGALLSVVVDATSLEIGSVADVVEGATNVAELLAAVEVMRASVLLAPLVGDTVGVITGPDEAEVVPFDVTVDDGMMTEVRPVSTVIGTTEAPEVLRE